jgi:2-oxoglutarate ferredoxin oxidoreductase subunit gamma
MEQTVVIAGFAQQGMLLAGKILARAAMAHGREVTWLPSYGPEMHEGTAHCTVIMADTPIGSPIVRRPDAAIVMNLPSLDRFEPAVKSGGLLVVNVSLTRRRPIRADVALVCVHATDTSQALGHIRVATMVTLGAYVAGTSVVEPCQVHAAIDDLFEATPATGSLYRRAFDAGLTIGRRKGRVEAA